MTLLTGLRILAVEQYGAGPFGTQALADLGAEVIKIENPRDGGDVTRSLGPFFDKDLGAGAESLFFQALNRNKKSVALDLNSADGQAVFHKLVEGADAVACNLRGDVPGKLGLTYDRLGPVKKDIVCCHLTAYGREGSRANWPGYDYLIQAECGYFYLNGEPDSAPSRFGLSIVDYATGYCLALSVLAGVMNARQTGKGRDIDVSLADVGLANLCYLAAWNLNRGYVPERVPRSGHPTLAPCQLFPTADGWIYIMANKEKFFPLLCESLGQPSLASDPRFVTFADRLKNRAEMTAALDPLFRKRTTDEWLAAFAGAIPAAPVLPMTEALVAPFIAQRGIIVDVESDSGTVLKMIGSPFRTGEPLSCRPAPSLGHDTEEMLRQAGYSPDSITKLRRAGTVA
jgi:crotonobetainyl-CoA:carnitine CoA-transferase CaiB-like acyl-CoA transferase